MHAELGRAWVGTGRRALFVHLCLVDNDDLLWCASCMASCGDRPVWVQLELELELSVELGFGFYWVRVSFSLYLQILEPS